MRDSRVGSFALAAGICDVLFRLVTVNILVDAGALGGLLMAATGSRFAMVYAVVAFKPARDSGFSSDFRVGTNPLTVVLAALITLVVGYAAVGPASLALMACAFTLTHFAGMARRQQGRWPYWGCIWRCQRDRRGWNPHSAGALVAVSFRSSRLMSSERR